MIMCLYMFFFFNDTATTEIYTLSLHDALPIFLAVSSIVSPLDSCISLALRYTSSPPSWYIPTSKLGDRKSTRLNSSHGYISYAVFCLKKKKKETPLVHNVQIYPDQPIHLGVCA